MIESGENSVILNTGALGLPCDYQTGLINICRHAQGGVPEI